MSVRLPVSSRVPVPVIPRSNLRARWVTPWVLVAALSTGCPSPDGEDQGVTGAESATDSDPTDTGLDSDTDTNTQGVTGTTPDGTADTGLIMNACGTFDPNMVGDSVFPQDPDDPEIIAACESLCDTMAEMTMCTSVVCLEECKLRSCQVCPGTLVPLVSCEDEFLDPSLCRCGPTGAICPTPDACSEQAGATNQCGG